MKNDFLLVAILLLFFSSCKNDSSTPTYTKSTEKSILTFTFNGLTPVVNATIDENAKTIKLSLPSSVNLTALVPTITFSNKATISPSSGVSQNFTSPVAYTVTAEDGSIQIYTVTVTQNLVGVPPTLSYSKQSDTIVVNTTKKSVTPSISWKSTNGSAGSFSLEGVPTGVTIDANTGVVSYANVPWGNYTYTVKATNFDNQIATVSQKLIVVTFGIRDDKKLADYEAVAANQGTYAAGTSYPDFRSSVNIIITVSGGTAIASGVLIAGKWVLTSGHNFFLPNGTNTPSIDPSTVKIRIGNNPNSGYQEYEVEGIILGPQWVASNGAFDSGTDIALVKLKVAVPSSVAEPALWNQTVGAETVGNMVWYAGFGSYSDVFPITGEDISRKHAYSNTLDRAISLSSTAGNLAFDFDGKQVNAFGDSYIGTDESKLGTGTSSALQTDFEGGTVKGDSGGPLYMYINGQWTVVGVLFGGISNPIQNHIDGDYGDVSVFTRIASHKDWITSTMTQYAIITPPTVFEVYKKVVFHREKPTTKPIYK